MDKRLSEQPFESRFLCVRVITQRTVTRGGDEPHGFKCAFSAACRGDREAVRW